MYGSGAVSCSCSLLIRGPNLARCQAEAPLIALCRFSKPALYRAKNFTLGDVVPADRLDLEPDESNREGSATFTINGINDGAGQPIMFGLEVCLDHSISTPRMRWANSTVYAIGKVVISPDDGLRYTCGIAHTSSASPT